MVSFMFLIGVVGAVWGLAQTVTPFQREIAYKLNTLMPNAIPDISSLIEQRRRGLISEKEYTDLMLKLGFSAEASENLYKASETLLTVSESLEAWRRGNISTQQLLDNLSKHGLTSEAVGVLMKLTERIYTISEAIDLYRRTGKPREWLEEQLMKQGVSREKVDEYLKLAEYFPSPPDLIRFAVREVFTPEIVKAYRMHEDLPKEFIELASKAGLPEEVAKWYWYAHWELPSFTEGLEMFHRKIISKEELLTLMRTLDIMPGWRDKLIQMSYALPTRVDLRRMFEIGVISRDELKEYYEKLGYSPEDAEKLTRWTEQEYVKEDKMLTVNQILELYEIGELNREEAKEWLKALGYTEEASEYKLRLREHEMMLKEVKEELELIEQQLKNGLITSEVAWEKIAKLPLSSRTKRLKYLKMVKGLVTYAKLPSVEKIEKWFKAKLISEEQFRNYLKMMFYRDEDINIWIEYLKKGGV